MDWRHASVDTSDLTMLALMSARTGRDVAYFVPPIYPKSVLDFFLAKARFLGIDATQDGNQILVGNNRIVVAPCVLSGSAWPHFPTVIMDGYDRMDAQVRAEIEVIVAPVNGHMPLLILV
ncbi:hypothetical protein [Myxococcus phage Mx1]|nr:hypothetical protein [Myxococcus phage Mx1]